MYAIWINVILTGLIAIFTFANVWCSWHMSKTAKQQLKDNKPIYVYKQDNVLYRIIRLGKIVGFNVTNGFKKSDEFFLYAFEETRLFFEIKLRNAKDTPEKYFSDIVEGKIDKIYTINS
ncbi:MAG: hypothetical protein LBL65_05760 [Campylobacteraceae bacterium]|jgi:hypothetical protein|nr:hypothetical protein [Campylobacteraceae bacterium]